ncbi:hypothetical protein DASC09_024780 [Saccharomycopsis crataegensis]|uniref:Uncharacterized protein n=1 Tax=Saccharomycopsis crataegensis TaxID=43959 RepID=A0AAV5QK48_9ASCO|nr:hypothetical protein DASC09_024780 [Saccharomycopsis crataegensis]
MFARSFQPIFRRTYVSYKKYYLHPLEKNVSLISFSKDPKHLAIGKISHGSVKYDELSDSNSEKLIDLDDTKFKENPEFMNRLLDFFAKNIYHDFSYQLETAEYAGSFMPVYDYRSVPEYGRRSDVDDVFGWVRVNDRCEMIEGSWQANTFYRPFTQSHGLPQLTDFTMENMEDITKP